MFSNRKSVITAILTTLVLSLISLSAAVPCSVQATPSRPEEYLPETNGLNSTDLADSVVTHQTMAVDPAASAPGQAANTAADNAWASLLEPLSLVSRSAWHRGRARSRRQHPCKPR